MLSLQKVIEQQWTYFMKITHIAILISAIILTLQSAAADALSIPCGSKKSIVYSAGKAPRYLAFDAVINTHGKYTSGGAYGLAVRLNGHALLASELVNKPFSINYNKGKLNYIDDGGRLFLPYLSTGQTNRISQTFVFKVENLAHAAENTLEISNIYNFYADSQVEISALRWLDSRPEGSQITAPQIKNRRLAGVISIPLGGKKSIPVSENPDRLSYLIFSGRIETNQWRSGAQPALIIRVNGQSVRAMRLKNKSPYFHFRTDSNMEWVSGDRINLGYYPLHQVKKTIDGHFIHDFVFDLSGLLKNDSSDVIELENIFAAFPGSTVELFDLRLSDGNFLRSRHSSETVLNSYGVHRLRQRAESLHRGVNKKFDTPTESTLIQTPIVFTPGQLPRCKISISEQDGGLEFRNNGEKLLLTTQYQLRGKTFTLQNNQLQTPELKVSRQIRFTAYGAIISDTLTNRTNKDLPVVMLHSFKLDLERLQSFRVAGEALPTFNLSTNNLTERKYSQTPLIFLQMPENSFGIYITDDVLRNQYSLLTVDETLHLTDDIFYLPPQKSYTTSFRIYSFPGNYYDCLNLLRKEFDLHQLIPGLFGFVYQEKNSPYYERYYRQKLNTPEKIREFFAASGITIPAATGNPMLYGSEKSVEWQKAYSVWEQFQTDIRSAKAPVKAFLHYCDVHLVAVKGDKDLDGQSLWQERLHDSVMLNADGHPVPYSSGKLYHVVPTLENSSGRQIKANLQAVLARHPANGIFFDEFNHSRARIAWNMSDNYSALLDKNGNITRKFAIVPLKAQPFLLDIARTATANGRIAYANQFDCTLQLMQLPLVHFAEPVAHEESYLIRAAQCSRSPLTLSCKRNTAVWSDIKYFLQYGVAVCYYASRSYGDHVLQKLYPLTVYEVQPGVIYGGNKLLTGRSGTYTLPGAEKLTVYIYRDPDGMSAETRQITGNTVDLQLDPATEVALIVVR